LSHDAAGFSPTGIQHGLPSLLQYHWADESGCAFVAEPVDGISVGRISREEPVGLVPIWHRLAALPSASPKVWMDAYLAAFATAGDLDMITFDQGFSQFPGANIHIVMP